MMADDVVFNHMATGQEHRGQEGVLQMLNYLYHIAFDADAESKKYNLRLMENLCSRSRLKARKQGSLCFFLSYLGNGSAPTFLCTSIHFPSRFT